MLFHSCKLDSEAFNQSSNQHLENRPPPTKKLGSLWRQPAIEVPEDPKTSNNEDVQQLSVRGEQIFFIYAHTLSLRIL
jgi:hypothetical protein